MKRAYLLTLAILMQYSVMADTSSDLATGNAAFDFVGSVILIVIAAFITRAIFAIPRIIRTLRGQAQLLALLAKKMDVEPDKIKEVMKYIDGKR
jgi:hypothetical protein